MTVGGAEYFVNELWCMYITCSTVVCCIWHMRRPYRDYHIMTLGAYASTGWALGSLGIKVEGSGVLHILFTYLF